MQNDKIYSDIISNLARTRTEANLLLNEVDLLMNSLYKVGEGDFATTFEKSIRAKTAYALSQLLTEQNREEVLKNLKNKISTLTYLSLTIAFEPTLEMISKLNAWVKGNIGEGVALDIILNTSILGGANIEYNGRVAGTNLLKEIDSYFSNTNVNF